MQEAVRIKAKSKKKAVKKAMMNFPSEINKDDLLVKTIKKKKGFLGFGGKNIYEVSLKEKQNSKRDKKILEMTEDVDVDGEFDFKVNEDGIFIKILPPEGNGEPVHYQQIQKLMDKKEIVEVDWAVVKECIEKKDDTWVKIAPRKPELDRDGEVSVKISDDKMKAFLYYSPPLGGKSFTAEDVKQIIEDKGVTYGIIEGKVEKIIKKCVKQEEIIIAEGHPPVPGKDGELIYHFEQKENSVGTEKDDGSIDFYDLGLITNVKPGDVLVTVKEPEPGESGRTVTGEEVFPPEPEEKKLPSGKNVQQKDENTLTAEIAGQVIKDGVKVNVLPVHEVNGDVDLSTGNIDFLGNVLVKGDVTEGFEVKAEGNIEVKGYVSAANIDSGGNVVVHKGFVGKDKYHINANDDVKVKFVENGEINTNGSIFVSDAVMHSNLNAGEMIEVTEQKGLLVGGKCRAGKKIRANIIGSSLATKTNVEAGVRPELKKRILEIKDDLEAEQNNLIKIKKAVDLLDKMKKNQGLPQEKEIMYNKLLRTRKRLQNSTDNKNNELEKLENEKRSLGQGRIDVIDTIYPGVELVVGNAHYYVEIETHHTSFIEDKGQVKQINL